MRGLPVSGATNVPHATIWVPCSPPNLAARSHGAVPWGRPAAATVGGAAGVAEGLWAAASITGVVIVTQGVAGPPGPSGPTVMLSREQLRVSAVR